MGSGEEQGLLNSCPECGDLVDVSSHGPYEKIACPSCGEAMRVRTHFNHFKIERRLGEGGMSQVFQARDLTLNRSVALKILHPGFTADTELTRRFETEARLTASINHPNVVKVYSVGEDQGYYYIAMEVVEGRNLEELIQAEGKISESRVWDIGVQVAQGLRAAQVTGLIHRDIKPGNILLAHGEVAKIVDFGLALVAGRDVDESNVIWATPYYVPPEKLHDEPEDHRSDIYSLGATLFHALAGHPPFDADTHSLEALRKIKDQPVSLADAAPEVSEETCRTIDRMLARNPADRYKDYDELLQDMNAARALGEQGRRQDPYSQRTLLIAAVVFFLGAVVIVWRGNLGDGGRKIEEIVDVEAPVSGLLETDRDGRASDGPARFIGARDLLLSGKYGKAREEFEKLIAEDALSWPTSDWASYNAGICALLEGDAKAARGLLDDLGSAAADPTVTVDEELSEFFLDVAARMRRDLPVMVNELDEARSGTVSAMAWLAYGLKNWQDGRFEEAVVFFEAFKEANPPQRLEWINAYKVLLEPFEKDIQVITRIPKPRSSMNLAEIEGMLETFAKLEGKLRVDGSGKRFFEERHTRARKMQEGQVEDLKRRERERIAALKMEEDRVRAEEEKVLGELLVVVEGLGKEQAFGEAVKLLENANFETEGARRAAQDALRIYRGADLFTATLIGDLNTHGYSGEISRVGAPALQGSIASASSSEIRVRLDLGEAFGESTLPFSSLSREGLLRIAEKIADGIAEKADRKKRREMAVFYARLTGMEEYSRGAGEALSLEDEEFAKFWKRLRPVAEDSEENQS